MPEAEQQRPSYFRQISDYFLPQHYTRSQHGKGKEPVRDLYQPTERSPLLGTALLKPPAILVTPASDEYTNRPLSSSTAIARPNIIRATTSAAPIRTDVPATPLLARPNFNRALTSTAAIAGRLDHYPDTVLAGMDHGRTSVLSRAAQVISNQLELGEGTSYAHRNAPPRPSYWNDQTHSRYLVRLWDAVEEQAAKSKYTVSTTARVVSTEKSMLLHFPELAKGDRALTRDFVEYVLGVALRHPFCTAEKMGRWEILASSGGARGTWGPW